MTHVSLLYFNTILFSSTAPSSLDMVSNLCGNLDSSDTAEACGTQTSPVNQASRGLEYNNPADLSRGAHNRDMHGGNHYATTMHHPDHPQTVPTDLSSTRRNNYDNHYASDDYSPRKSLKSIIDNIVKTETLSKPRYNPRTERTSHMALPVMLPGVPPLPLPISSIAQHHASLARLLARGPMVLPPVVTSPATSMQDEQDQKHDMAFPHKKFRPDTNMPSDEAVCLKKEVTPTSPITKEGNCFPESMSPLKMGYPEKENTPTANIPARYQSAVSLPPSNVTSALRDLLTAKLSSQPAPGMDTESQDSERLVIDEDSNGEMMDFDSDMSQGTLTEEDLLDQTRQPNTCQVCGQSFQYRSSFRRHMKVHQGIFSHVCAICGRKFTRKEHFVRHKCSRKPNKASRGAHVESPAAAGITPKVEFPPMSSPDHRSEASYDSTYQEFPDSPAKQKSSVCAESRRKAAVPRKIVMMEEGDLDASFEDDQMQNAPVQYSADDLARSPSTSSAGYPSPMKSGSVVSCPSPNQYHTDMYYSPRREPHAGHDSYSPQQESTAGPQDELTNDTHHSPVPEHFNEGCSSPRDGEPMTRLAPYSPITDPEGYSPQREQESWGSNTYTEALDLSRPQVISSCSPPQSVDQTDHAVPSPQIPLATGVSTQEFTIHTGSYKVVTGAGDQHEEGDRGKFIKVVKQGNYLKLKEEAQVIGGQLCFVCPTCSKVFHRSSNFSRHMRIHRGVYSYVCPNCQRGFFRREHFQKHKCSRKGMSHTWDRKTKIDMILTANESALEGSDADGGSDNADSEESFPITTELGETKNSFILSN